MKNSTTQSIGMIIYVIDILFYFYFFVYISFFKPNQLGKFAFSYMSIGTLLAFLVMLIKGFYTINSTSLQLALEFLVDFSFSISIGLFTLLLLTYTISLKITSFLYNKGIDKILIVSLSSALFIFLFSSLSGTFINSITAIMNENGKTGLHIWKVFYNYTGKPLFELLLFGSIPSLLLGFMAGVHFHYAK